MEPIPDAHTCPVSLRADRPEDILSAARILRTGGLVVIPTDTVYGLAASVFQPEAIERIFEVKRRPPESALPVLLASAVDLPILVRDVPRTAWILINRFWPGPLTLILPASPTLTREVTRGSDTVAVRVPAHRPTLMLLQCLGEPIAGTSANMHGAPPASTSDEVIRQIGANIDGILVDDETPRSGLASTVVEVLPDECVLHRKGSIGADQIRQAVGLRLTIKR